MSHGAIHWSECITEDVEGAKSHYGLLCGWTFEQFPMPNGGVYWVAMNEGQPVAGIMALSAIPAEQEMKPHWMTYIEVSDVDAAAAKAGDAGGRVMQPPFDVPNVGRISMIADPGGAVVGLIQPAPQPGA